MLNPILNFVARVKVREGLSGTPGVKFFKINSVMRHFDDAAEVTLATADFGMPAGFMVPDDDTEAPTVGAIGDGTFIQMIRDWLASPEGKAFIAAVLKKLLALLGL
jgi:hypothetical protein